MIKSLLACCLALACLPAFACLSPTATAVFVHRYNPGDVHAFYRGRLGILQPSYGRRHLVVAYRWLNGLDLDEAEARLLMPSAREADAAAAPDAAIRDWLQARSRMGGAVVRIVPDRRGADFESQPNCSADAFRTATRTLRERLARHGRNDPAVRHWLQGQDAVFSNCAGPGALPEALSASVPAWLHRDRAYQLAAARYYRGEYLQAAQGFAAIAADPASPWRSLSAYLVARARTRLAEAGRAEQSRREADDAIARVLQDASLVPWHLDALKLRLRLASSSGICPAGLEAAVLAPRLSPNAWQEVQDFLVLCTSGPQGPGGWLRNLRDANHGRALAEALAAWRPQHNRAWLVAALQHGDALGRVLHELLDEAATLGKEDPAFLTANYYRLRALRTEGRDEDARQLADALLALPGLDGSARNLLLAERMALARDLATFLRDARRLPVEIGYPGSETSYLATTAQMHRDPDLTWRRELRRGKAEYFDADAVSVFNAAMPLAMLRQVAEQESLPAHLRSQLRSAAFTRAYLLGKTDLDLAVRLARDYPGVRELAALGSVRNGDVRRFLVAVALLRLPGITPLVEIGFGRAQRPDRIGLEGPRWWDRWRPCWHHGGSWDGRIGLCVSEPRRAGMVPPLFLRGAGISQAQEEAVWLQKADSPAGLLGPIVLNWATAHPNDPRVPEALHLVVRASRYAGVECAGSQASQQAFRLLHTRFKANAWAAKTHHWYGDRTCLR